MRLFNVTALSEAVVGTASVYTSGAFNEQLAEADQLAIQAVVDQVAGTSPTLTVAVEASSDGRNWTQKHSTPEINAQSLGTASTNVFIGTESNAAPSQGMLRLSVTLGGTDPAARIKLHVCGRGIRPDAAESYGAAPSPRPGRIAFEESEESASMAEAEEMTRTTSRYPDEDLAMGGLGMRRGQLIRPGLDVDLE